MIWPKIQISKINQCCNEIELIWMKFNLLLNKMHVFEGGALFILNLVNLLFEASKWSSLLKKSSPKSKNFIRFDPRPNVWSLANVWNNSLSKWLIWFDLRLSVWWLTNVWNNCLSKWLIWLNPSSKSLSLTNVWNNCLSKWLILLDSR